jgi:hypothetical protein
MFHVLEGLPVTLAVEAEIELLDIFISEQFDGSPSITTLPVSMMYP